MPGWTCSELHQQRRQRLGGTAADTIQRAPQTLTLLCIVLQSTCSKGTPPPVTSALP